MWSGTAGQRMTSRVAGKRGVERWREAASIIARCRGNLEMRISSSDWLESEAMKVIGAPPCPSTNIFLCEVQIRFSNFVFLTCAVFSFLIALPVFGRTKILSDAQCAEILRLKWTSRDREVDKKCLAVTPLKKVNYKNVIYKNLLSEAH